MDKDKIQYCKIKCGCEKNAGNELTYQQKGFPILSDDDFKFKKKMIESGKCKICGQSLKIEKV